MLSARCSVLSYTLLYSLVSPIVRIVSVALIESIRRDTEWSPFGLQSTNRADRSRSITPLHHVKELRVTNDQISAGNRYGKGLCKRIALSEVIEVKKIGDSRIGQKVRHGR